MWSDVVVLPCPPASITVHRRSVGDPFHLFRKGRRLEQRVPGKGIRSDRKREQGLVQLVPVYW